MSLRGFLDACEALMVEEHRKLGADLLTALERMKQWGRGHSDSGSAGPALTTVSSARQNDDALAQLQGLLSGVEGAPG